MPIERGAKRKVSGISSRTVQQMPGFVCKRIWHLMCAGENRDPHSHFLSLLRSRQDRMPDSRLFDYISLLGFSKIWINQASDQLAKHQVPVKGQFAIFDIKANHRQIYATSQLALSNDAVVDRNQRRKSVARVQ